jgi:RNA polymerase sigma factor (TIGR02999 family)
MTTKHTDLSLPDPELELAAARPPGEAVTAWLEKWGYGDSQVLDSIFPELYHELRNIGHRVLAKERRNHTLSTTALVHESYLRLLGQKRLAAQNREEFFAIAGVVMRRILVDHARNRNRQKRGGDAVKIPLGDAERWLTSAQAEEAEALDHALDRLAKRDPRAALIVHHRFFVGLSCAEIAELIGVSVRTVKRDWSMARTWLRREIRNSTETLAR